MAQLVASSLKTFLDGLDSTHEICTEFGSALTFGTNLFIGIEPETSECITVIPYGGSTPERQGSRQESALQVRVKASTIQKSLQTSQSMINTLQNNASVCTGYITAVQSTPIIIGDTESGEYFITVSNYTIKHVRI